MYKKITASAVTFVLLALGLVSLSANATYDSQQSPIRISELIPPTNFYVQTISETSGLTTWWEYIDPETLSVEDVAVDSYTLDDSGNQVVDSTANDDGFDGFGYSYVTLDNWVNFDRLSISDWSNGCFHTYSSGASIAGVPQSDSSTTLDIARGDLVISCETEPVTLVNLDGDDVDMNFQIDLTLDDSWAKWNVRAASVETATDSLQVAIIGELGSDEGSRYVSEGLTENSLISFEDYGYEYNDSNAGYDPVIGYRSTFAGDFRQVAENRGEYELDLDPVLLLSSAVLEGRGGDSIASVSDKNSVAAGGTFQDVYDLEVFAMGYNMDAAGAMSCAVGYYAPKALAESQFGTYLEPVTENDPNCGEYYPPVIAESQDLEICVAAVEPSQESGTYQISSAANLVWLSEQYGQDIMGSDFLMTADIDLQNCAFSSIGRDSVERNTTPFTGVFDGGGHSIENLRLQANDRVYDPVGDGNYSSLGLFSVLHGGTIENLSIEGTVDDDGAENYGVGLLAGFMYNLISGDVRISEALISNVTVSGEVYGDDEVGGVVGYVDGGRIEQATATRMYIYGAEKVGGIVGSMAGNGIFDSHASFIEFDHDYMNYVGGIVGKYSIYDGPTPEPFIALQLEERFPYTTDIIRDVTVTSVNFDADDDDWDYVGGVAGEFTGSGILDASVHDAYFDDIYDNVGGIVGQFNGHLITGSRVSDTYIWADDNVGGVVGSLKTPLDPSTEILVDSQAVHSFVDAEDYVGGIAGYVYEASISGAIFSGYLKADEYSGGVIGYYEGNGEIFYAESQGLIDGDYEIAGIVGHTEASVVRSGSTMTIFVDDDDNGGLVGHLGSEAQLAEAYYNGLIYSTGDQVGGLVGENDGHVLNSYSVGRLVSEGFDVGGIVGTMDYTITDSYSVMTYEGDYNTGGIYGDVDDYDDVYDSYSLEGAGDEDGTGYSNDRTAQQLRTQGTYEGWDFMGIWTFGVECEYPYPQLQWVSDDPDYWNGCGGSLEAAFVPEWPLGSAPYGTKSVSSAPYVGPIVTSISNTRLSSCEATVITVAGSKLSGVELSIQGVLLEILESSETSLLVRIPSGLEPEINADLTVNSAFGVLRVQDAVSIRSLDCNVFQEESVTAWTKKLNPGTVKIYAKNIVEAGKIQFMFNGKEIAWVNAATETDSKLRTANGAHYLVRTVELIKGQKNIVEVYLNGEIIRRAAYSY